MAGKKQAESAGAIGQSILFRGREVYSPSQGMRGIAELLVLVQEESKVAMQYRKSVLCTHSSHSRDQRDLAC